MAKAIYTKSFRSRFDETLALVEVDILEQLTSILKGDVKNPSAIAAKAVERYKNLEKFREALRNLVLPVQLTLDNLLLPYHLYYFESRAWIAYFQYHPLSRTFIGTYCFENGTRKEAAQVILNTL